MNYTLINNPLDKTSYGKKTFLLGLLLGCIILIPFIVYCGGLFLYYGDFNVQQIPFYQMLHDTIQGGNIGWSSTTDLGASIIGSYSFYNLTSPFFLFTLLFPSAAVPYLMGPLLILKLALSSLSGYIFLRRYVRFKDYAVLGGLLYGFSGFSIYNIFFNHFHEAMIIFPLLLAAIDEYMYTRRRGVVALAVFAACFINYYFFVGQVVFVLLYWVVRMLCNSWKINLKDFAVLAFEVVLGFAATAIVLLPTVLVVTQNPRVDSAPSGWWALLYNIPQRYMHIFTSMFFPPDIPAIPNFTPDSESKWASVAAYLPVFSMSGVIAYMQMRRRGWLKKLISVLLLCTAVPLLNSAFQLFNSSYYARWFYMLTLMFVLATVLAIEDTSEVDYKRGLSWTAGITTAVALAIGFMPKKETIDGVEKTTYGLMRYPDRFWIYVAITLIGLIMAVLIISALRKNKRKYMRKVFATVSVFIVLYSAFIIFLGSTYDESYREDVIPTILNNGDNLKLDDIQNVRSDFYYSMDNVGMYWRIPTIQAFHSIVPGSIMEFYPTIGVARDVGSRADSKTYGLRGLTSCKYLFDCNLDSNNFVNSDGNTDMPGWKELKIVNHFTIFENEYYIPYGFTYDKFITREEYDKCPESERHLLLLKAMVVDSDTISRNPEIADKLTTIADYTFDKETYYSDCKALAKTACSDFAYSDNGFTATANTPSGGDKLVFFSVPYEDGWSATVDGKEVQIEKTNVGFMSVRVPGGATSKIEFKYQTPGLKTGAIVSAVCAVVFIIYLLICRRNRTLWGDKSMRTMYRITSSTNPAYLPVATEQEQPEQPDGTERTALEGDVIADTTVIDTETDSNNTTETGSKDESGNSENN